MHNYEELYKKLIDNRWFENCGDKEVVYENLDYIWAKDMKDVEKNVNSIKWENMYIEEMNEITMFLDMNYLELSMLWNEQIEMIERKYMVELRKRIREAANKHSLPERVVSQVGYALKIIFICEFYSEQYHSEFYENLLEIYLSGHLPCGYKGRYRKGSIIIY